MKKNRVMVEAARRHGLEAGKDIAGQRFRGAWSKGAIKKTLKFEEGAKCLVIRGTHAAETGTIKEITKGSAVRAQTVKVGSGSSEFETLADNVMVVGA